jgi:hypothetical protein
MKWIYIIIEFLRLIFGRKKPSITEQLTQEVLKDVKEFDKQIKKQEQEKEQARKDDDIILFRDIGIKLSADKKARDDRLVQFATAILHQSGYGN